MNKLFKYDDFLSELNLESLLETKIVFADDFKRVLDEMDNVTADKLLNLEGQEVDVNSNYIDVVYDKDGFISFKPEDKLLKKPYLYNSGAIGCSYVGMSEDISRSGNYSLGKIKEPENGQVVELVKEFGQHELADIVPNYSGALKWLYSNQQTKLYHIKFLIDGIEYNIICNNHAISRDISDIKNTEVKIGKFVNSIFNKAELNLSAKELEEFVNKYKYTISKIKNKFSKFRIISGEEIRKFYLEDNYLNGNGTLGKSCMRYGRCQKYLDIYVNNPNIVSMVILMSDEPDKICGRAILWTTSKGLKLMDRIYTNFDYDEILFKDFAKSNGFLHKKNQDSMSGSFVGVNGESVSDDFIVQLDSKGQYDYYPYMDTFQYYNFSNGVLSNSSNFNFDYELTDTEGGNGNCDTCGGSGTAMCYRCDGDGDIECDECNAGTVECSNCDGSGKEDCSTCDGSGKGDCGECGGSGEDSDGNQCSECDGDGEVDCSNCDGSGEEDCSECDGNCGVDCDTCGGGGSVTCFSCDGTGEVDCPDCN
jgi:hypothetical protein